MGGAPWGGGGRGPPRGGGVGPRGGGGAAGAGRVRESGVYLARVKKSDSGVLYQSFVLVK